MDKAPEKMSLLEKMSYGFGNMGLCLVTTIITTFIMYFYTDVVKISLLQVGTIMMLGGIADAVSDLALGILVDKTNSRWGKSRPYLLIFAIPLAVACFFVFRVPQAGDGVRYAYAMVTYLIYTLAYTCICIPQNVLMASITNDPKDRLATNMFGSLGTNIGQLIPNALALSLVAVLGKGSEYDGFGRVAIVFGVVGALLILADFKFTHERCNPPAGEKITMKDTIQAFNNLPWLISTVTTLLTIVIVVIRASSTVYFTQNVLNAPEMASRLLSISNIIAIPITLVIPFFASKFGKRNLVLLGGTMGILGSAGIFLFKSNLTLVMVLSVLISIGIALPNGVVYVMAAESIDYGEWKFKKRVQGSLMAFVGFAVKVSNSIATMAISAILNAGGYVGGAETQTASAVKAIEFNYLGLPMILFAVVIVANLFYTLDKKYPQIKAELDERHKSMAV